MNYETFLGAVERGLNERLSDDITVMLHKTVKNNGMEKQGVTIIKKDVNISPTIYLEEFYQQYLKGRTLEEIIRKIDHFYHEVRYEESLDTEKLQKYDYLRDKIMFRLINKEKNSKLLEKIPYLDYQDLALVFYVLLDVRKGGSATITITNDMMHMWNCDVEKLYQTAQINGRRNLPAVLTPMRDVIDELIRPLNDAGIDLFEEEPSFPDKMYVLTNEIRSFGAAVIAYEYVLEMVAEKLQSNFFVLPSSIHEVILICADSRIRQEELDETIQEVNETQVEPEEVLGDHAYYYDRERKALYF